MLSTCNWVSEHQNLKWLSSKLSGFKCFFGLDNSRYLTRYTLLHLGLALRVYLHEFHRADNDRHRHNHPWAFAISIVLCGGYFEDREHDARWRLPFSVRIIRRDDYHTIMKILPNTWTLFIPFGRNSESWGFYIPGTGHVPWQLYKVGTK